MADDARMPEGTEGAREVARLELRRAIRAALAAGTGWPAIIRLLAEHGPGELPGGGPRSVDGET